MFVVLYNALKNTTTGRIKIGATEKINDFKKFIQIQIIDTGCGIKSDLQNKLRKYFQEKNPEASNVSNEIGFAS